MKTKKRVLTKQRRLDTTLSKLTVARLAMIAKRADSSGRRYAMSNGEAADAAIDWMSNQKEIPAQVIDFDGKDIRLGLILSAESLVKLKKLAVRLSKRKDYVKPYRSKELSLGAALDWCVTHYWHEIERGSSGKQGQSKSG